MEIDTAAPAPMPPPTLAELARDIRDARAKVRAMRAAPVVPPNLLSARQTLLRAMEVYAHELSVRRLPIPPRLRDDLRLQRDIRGHPNGSPRPGQRHSGGQPTSASATWSHRASWAGDPQHVTEARRFVTNHLIQHGLISEVDTVGPVISELATNVVIHAGTPFTVTLLRSDRTLSVAVSDLSFERPEHLPSERLLDKHGRGLAMIAALSSTWGSTSLNDGKLVWATFDLDAPTLSIDLGESP